MQPRVRPDAEDCRAAEGPLHGLSLRPARPRRERRHGAVHQSARVEDIDALVRAAGGSAFAVGLSSGAALALEAAASGLPLRKLAVYEPPFVTADAAGQAQADHLGRLKALVVAGERGAAVKYFMRDMVNVPAPFVLMMQLMRGVWNKLKAVAHTLPYDAAIMGNWQVPAARLAGVRTPTLAMYGGKTETRLKRAVEELVKVLPNVRQEILPGQTHNVSAAVLVPALVEFLKE